MAIQTDELNEQHKEHEVKVRFTYLNTNAHVSFDVARSRTLQSVWDEAYTKLGESPRPNDELLCGDGNPMTAHLGLTMAEMEERHICRERHFQIRSETGGA